MSYIFIYHAEPQFVVEKDLLINTDKGEYYIKEGKMIGLLKSEDGRLFIGTGKNNSDQLEIRDQKSASTLLETCQPSNFELALDDEGDSYVRPVLLEQKVTQTEKISRITLTENINTNTVPVTSIKLL